MEKLLKYEFFAADKKFHKPELEQFEAMDDVHAQETVGAAIGDVDGQAFFDEPIVSNPAALYGRSWFVYVPAQHEHKAVFAGYLYTTGR